MSLDFLSQTPTLRAAIPRRAAAPLRLPPNLLERPRWWSWWSSWWHSKFKKWSISSE